ncbi:MAG: helix-turn-helix transcriptional regulator [Pirellulales bacterium]|nr:helix-turn-helix transcriptional regulator [Pirellulales bacterium]
MTQTISHVSPGNNVSVAPYDPREIAKFLTAFVECNREMQELALEMSAILSAEDSTDDERQLAADALLSALFPSITADELNSYHQRLKSPAGIEASTALRSEQEYFSTRVKQLMAEKGITQEMLAQAIDVGQPAISNLLNRGCRPQRRTIERIANSLGVSCQEIWPGE